MVDQCSNIQGFMIYNSIGGGTGSGLSSLLLERLSVDYSKKIKFGINIYPHANLTSSVVEPYNSLLAVRKLIEHLDISMVLDNTATYEICQKQLEIESPNYLNMNQLLSQLISTTTSSLRHDGVFNSSLEEFNTNLVPYPRIVSLLNSYAPINSLLKLNNSHDWNSVSDITNNCFELSHLFAKCDFLKGSNMACCIMYKGDVVPKEINTSIALLKSKKKIKFVDWCPPGFKCGVNFQTPKVFSGGIIGKSIRSASVICNNTAVCEVFSRIYNQFHLMYSKGAFVHWYFEEGMEECEFIEAREDITALNLDYQEVGGTLGKEDPPVKIIENGVKK